MTFTTPKPFEAEAGLGEVLENESVETKDKSVEELIEEINIAAAQLASKGIMANVIGYRMDSKENSQITVASTIINPKVRCWLLQMALQLEIEKIKAETPEEKKIDLLVSPN